MRCCANRIATRRISWTDQRIRGRWFASRCLFLGVTSYSPDGERRPSGRKPSSPVKRGDVGSGRTPGREEREFAITDTATDQKTARPQPSLVFVVLGGLKIGQFAVGPG